MTAKTIFCVRAGPTSTSPALTVDSWVPPRDVFRYFSVRLDLKF
ncbi:hypothetical protein [Massilia putida]|nr:hypothetical protein [Massilia putida]